MAGVSSTETPPEPPIRGSGGVSQKASTNILQHGSSMIGPNTKTGDKLIY